MKLPLRNTARVLAAMTAALAVAIPSTAAAHNRVKEYSLAEFAVPADITTGPDGALYAPDGSLGRLWRVTTKGKVSSFELGGGPAGVATGPDGALWVTDRDGRIDRVTTAGEITSYPVPTSDGFPTDIVAGPDGALWFTESRGDRIGRITTSGQITEYPIPTAGAFAADIAAGPDGALWFTESSGNKVGRITTSGQLTEFPLETPDSLPGAIVTGRDGALYFAEGNTNVISRMNTAGTVTGRYPLPTANATPLGLVSTRHGLYVAEHSASAIAPLRLWGGFGRELRTKSSPDAITLGPDGALWYTSGNEAKIGRLELDR
jgi:virginiamycin B lyase